MSKRHAKMCVLYCTILSSMVSGCNRGNSFNGSQPSEVEFEKSLRSYVGHINGLVELHKILISESFSNAYAKAEKRKSIGIDHGIIPVYCSIQEAECSSDLNSNRGICGFRLEVRCLGDRVERRDLDRIWLIVVSPSHSDGLWNVLETSLANITHGMGSSWSNFNFGEFWCRCNDPRLGWGNEKLSWNTIIANGTFKMYFLLDDGGAWGRRHGKTSIKPAEVKSKLEWLNEKGVLIELVPIAASKQVCVLECQ